MLAPERATEPSAHGSDGAWKQQTQNLAGRAGSAQAGGRGARYLWAVLLARMYEAFPLTCPHCAAEMRIMAFVTDRVPDSTTSLSRGHA